MRSFRPLFILLGFIFLSSFALAQDTFADFKTRLDQQTQSIATVSETLDAPEATSDLYASMRDVLRHRLSDLLELQNDMTPALEEAQARLNDLGPEPSGEGATPEPENIKKLRGTLSEQALNYEGLRTEISLELANVERLLDRIAELRRQNFVDQLFTPAPSFGDAQLWSNAKQAVGGLRDRTAKAFGELGTGVKLIGSAIILLFFGWFGLATLRSAQTLRGIDVTTLGEKLQLISNSMVKPLLIFAGLGVTLTLGARFATGALPAGDSLFFVLYGVAALLCFGFLTLNRFEALGLIGRMTETILLAIAVLYCIDAVLVAAGRSFGAGAELLVAQSYVTTGLVAVLALGLAVKYWLAPEGRLFLNPRHQVAMWGLGSFGVLLFALNLYGYPALARFSLRVVVLLLFFGLFLLVLRIWARGMIARLNAQMYVTDVDDGPNFSTFWFNLILDVILAIAALPWLLRIIGTDWVDIQDWAYRAFFGFSIGQINISVANILIGLGLFIGLLLVTRLGQRVLASKVLTQTRLDSAMRQSIVQVVGYAGLALALLVGVASIGFDLTNVAIVAGALSVGIGFGLQSIVSNFVSGLILVFERPIKIGDWVGTSAGEGTVKKISVRGTEIETFDRNIVIVPNSELISGSVKNWTRHNSVGRIVVRVGASYDADPHAVKDILEQVAEAHPAAMKNPGPSVVFRDFGDSALIFDLRIFIRDINDVATVETELRLAIWDALSEAGVEISYRQQDIHIRSAAGLEAVMTPPTKKRGSG